MTRAKSQIPLRYLDRTSFEPASSQLRTGSEPASVMEFGFNKGSHSFNCLYSLSRQSTSVHGLAPKYLADLFVPVAEVAGRRQLPSASRGLLDLPRFNKSNYGRRAFSFAGPHTWNNTLPDQLQTPVSLATFKRSLNTFLFEQITHLAH